MGKSTLLNRFAGDTRVTVDAAPGTTRDAIEATITRGGRAYGVVDTAGVRPRPKLKTVIDIVSVKRSLSAIEETDGCLMLLDASVGIVADDLTLLGIITKRGRPCVVVLNKWDLIDAGNPEQFAERFWQRAPFAKCLPVITASTKTGYHVEEALRLAATVAERGRQAIPGATLKQILRHLQEATDRPGRLRQVRLVRLRQMNTPPVSRGPRRPLTLELTIHGKVRLRQSDLAFVERVIRHGAPLEGVPIRVTVRVV
ncbi:MAG: GTP-binding protein [Candidatus Omnitrophica bacterium]|nr:GTP-binding protein [Candidatus Omnitrophota bacterium]